MSESSYGFASTKIIITQIISAMPGDVTGITYDDTVCEVPKHAEYLECAYEYLAGVFTFTVTALKDFTLEPIDTLYIDIYAVVDALDPTLDLLVGVTYDMEM